jgi:glycosyltransferase involved in cell wall biosynthesis
MPISIGIPFYNAERFLADAIRSIFAQTFQDWELILVDDGSTDESLDIARSVKDERVRVISDGDNKWLSYRLNQIVQEARFDYIGRMDADDLTAPTRFEKQIAILEGDHQIDLVSSGVFSVTDKLLPIGARWPDSQTLGIRELLEKKNCGVVHPSILGRKSWFLRNPYDPSVRIAQDYELWARSCSKGDFNIHLIKEPLHYYREESNATSGKMLEAYRNDRKMLRKYGEAGEIPLVMKSFCKSAVVSMLSKINRMDILLKRRSQEITDPDMLELFNKEISVIKDTKVPGLD